MKSSNFVFLLGLALILVLSCGCVSSSDLSGKPSREVPTTLPANKASPTSTQFQTTVMPTFRPTATNTLVPVFTRTLTPSITPTSFPTLSAKDAQLRFMNLLTSNGGCRLPCLWGIMPGATMAREAQNILDPLSSILDFTAFSPESGNITPYYTEGNLLVYINVGFLAKDGIVTKVHFEGRALRDISNEQIRGVDNVFNSKLFGERLSLYMLPEILADYGRPHSVMLLTLAEVPPSYRDPGVNFNILLLYPDQGILVHYTTEMRVVGDNVTGCPANAHVEMELFPSGNSDSFFELLKSTYWPANIKIAYKPLEEVTSMTIDDFYQTFRSTTEECLETPANLWPVPEK